MQSICTVRLLPACLLLLLSGAALAAQPGAAEFEQGMQLYRTGDCPAAVEQLEIANKALARPGGLKALGFCYRQMKQFPKAADAYQRYLQLHADDEKRVLFLLEQTLQEEREWRRDHPPPPPANPAPATAADEPETEGPVVPASKQPPLAPALPAVPAEALSTQVPPPPAGPRPRLWTFVAGGAGIVSATAGLVLGFKSRATANEIKGSEHSTAQVNRLGADVKSQAQHGNLLLGVGAGLLLVSGGLFVLRF